MALVRAGVQHFILYLDGRQGPETGGPRRVRDRRRRCGTPSADPGLARSMAYSTSPCSAPSIVVRPLGMERAHEAHAEALHDRAGTHIDGHRAGHDALRPELAEREPKHGPRALRGKAPAPGGADGVDSRARGWSGQSSSGRQREPANEAARTCARRGPVAASRPGVRTPRGSRGRVRSSRTSSAADAGRSGSA